MCVCVIADAPCRLEIKAAQNGVARPARCSKPPPHIVRFIVSCLVSPSLRFTARARSLALRQPTHTHTQLTFRLFKRQTFYSCRLNLSPVYSLFFPVLCALLHLFTISVEISPSIRFFFCFFFLNLPCGVGSAAHYLNL